ncbi:MFS transporter [Paraburkholderia sp. RL17-373-BIF-A]|uniref:MFS transporter n=1 Tax=Paraburkholderia sp. RL17-373-BIF-A TaxID=3031629 RepID=UPI0038B9C135
MKKWRIMGVVTYALFIDYLIYGLVVPLISHTPIGTMSESNMAQVYGSYAVGVLSATLLFGYVGDRLGHRRLMMIGVLLSACGTLLFWWAPNYPLHMLARGLLGAASAGTWTAGLALVAERYRTKRVEMMGYALGGGTAGSIVGPLLGGLMFELGGYSLPFEVTGVLLALDVVLCFSLLPRDRPAMLASIPLRMLFSRGAILVPAIAVMLAAFGWGIVEPLMPQRLTQLGATPVTVGLTFTIATLAYGASAPLVSWTSRRLPIKRVVGGGAVAMAIFLATVGFAPDVILASAALCLLSVSFAFTLNPASAELGNAVDRLGIACYAAVYAVYNIAYSIGMMAANALASVVSEEIGFLYTLLTAGTVMLICSAFLLQKDLNAVMEPKNQ